MGRSQSGFSRKVHVMIDGLGNSLRMCPTSGQRHDSTQSQALLQGLDFEHLIVNRGYAPTDFIEYLLARIIKAVIPLHQWAKILR